MKTDLWGQEVKMPLKSPKKKRLEPPQLVHEEQKAIHAVSRSRSAKTSSTAQRVSAIDNFVGNIVQNSSKFSTAAWLPCAHVKQSSWRPKPLGGMGPQTRAKTAMGDPETHRSERNRNNFPTRNAQDWQGLRHASPQTQGRAVSPWDNDGATSKAGLRRSDPRRGRGSPGKATDRVSETKEGGAEENELWRKGPQATMYISSGGGGRRWLPSKSRGPKDPVVGAETGSRVAAARSASPGVAYRYTSTDRDGLLDHHESLMEAGTVGQAENVLEESFRSLSSLSATSTSDPLALSAKAAGALPGEERQELASRRYLADWSKEQQLAAQLRGLGVRMRHALAQAQVRAAASAPFPSFPPGGGDSGGDLVPEGIKDEFVSADVSCQQGGAAGRQGRRGGHPPVEVRESLVELLLQICAFVRAFVPGTRSQKHTTTRR